ncbi:MAG: DUF4125 family protein, partial [Erysipelotrichaceae bacterium]|nr:DUF4125 family protein [Erysipelotrichaceae bacterium]
ETYLRGELGTYSDRTFMLYKSMTERLEKEGKNLVVRNMEYTAKLYGYEGIDDIENRMRRKQA